MMKSIRAFARSQDGFSLTEVIIAAGVVGIVAAGTTSMMTVTNRTAMTGKATADFSSLVSSVQSILNNSNQCVSALSNVAFNKNQPTVLTSGLRVPLANGQSATMIPAVNTPYNNALKITALEFSALQNVSGNMYSTVLTLKAERTVGGGAMGVAQVRHDFPMLLAVNFAGTATTNGVVASCSSAEALWQRVGGSGQNIYYTNGNVGIGTTVPAFPLDVTGYSRASGFTASQGVPNSVDSSTNGFAFGGDRDTGLFSPGSGNDNGQVAIFANNLEVARFLSSGNVGIGNPSPGAKLVVEGGVQIKNDSGACDSNRAGTLRYLSGKIELCNGSAWRDLSAAGTDCAGSWTTCTNGTQTF